MKKYVKHILTALACYLLILVCNFALPRLLPGDPVAYLTGFEEEEMSAEIYEYYYHALHLDQNVFMQFGYYIKDIFNGTLGYSFKSEAVVSTLIFEKIGYSLQITLPAILLSIAIGLVWGLHAGYKKDGVFDKISTTSMLVLNAMPTFMIALLLVIALCFESKLFPYAGLSSGDAQNAAQFFADRLYHLVLPIACVTLASLPSKYMLVRNTSAQFCNDKSVTYAKQRGLSTARIEYAYVFKNVAQPFVTMVGSAIGSCIAGSVVVENVFSINGVGTLLTNAVNTLDYPLVQGILFVTTTIMIICLVLSDLACMAISPKARRKGESV